MINSLDKYEMNLVIDAEILLTKNKIIKKVHELFGKLLEDYEDIFKVGGLTIVNEPEAKISRGENYQGLPYVVLDYPRRFSKTDVFAIRSLFWWGNFFSITLHLGGSYQQKYAAVIERSIYENLFAGWYICIAENAWDHHFENNNYTPVNRENNYHISSLPHIKMAKKIPLNKWDEVDVFFEKHFTFLIKMLAG